MMLKMAGRETTSGPESQWTIDLLSTNDHLTVDRLSIVDLSKHDPNLLPRVLSLPPSREEERGPWERG